MTGARRLPEAAGLRAGATLLLLLLAWAPAGNNLFWGANLWSVLGGGWRFVPLALLPLVWIPAPRLPLTPDRGAAVLAAALAGVWLLLPARSLLFGDGIDIARALTSAEPILPRSPLYRALVSAGGDGLGPAETERFLSRVALISTVCGLAWLAGVAWLALRKYRGIALAGTGVLAGGYLALFQGYVEAYGLFALLLSGYLVTLTFPAGRARTLAALAWNLAAFAAHTLALVLVPVTLLVAMGGARLRARRLLLAGGVLALLAASWGALATLLPDSSRLLNPAEAAGFAFRQIGYAFAARPWTSPTGVFHAGQVVDVVNGVLLSMAPAALVILWSACVAAPQRELVRVLRTPLGWAAILLTAARLLTSTPLGPVLDWDLYAAMNLPWVFVAWRVVSAPGVQPAWESARHVPAVLGVATLLPWMLVLHQPHAAESRLVAYRDGSPPPNPYVAAHVEHRLGDALARNGNAAAAAAAFQRAHAAYPRDVYARREAQAWLEAGQTERALPALSSALELNPLDATSRRLRAGLYLQQGRADLAEADYRALLSVDPEDPNAIFGMARLASAAGDSAAAHAAFANSIDGFLRLVREHPHLLLERRQLVLALIAVDRWEDALWHSEQLLQQTSGSAADWYHRALAEARLGRIAMARQSLHEALTRDPGSRPAQELLRMLDPGRG